jgi:hypothetical protein
MYLMLLFLSSSEIGFDTADVDSFDKAAMIDVYSSVCVIVNGPFVGSLIFG